MLIDGLATDRDYFYAHLQAPTPLAEGERVRTGERIGEVGKTGNARSEFCQLHFELWPHGYHDGGPRTRSRRCAVGRLLLSEPSSLAADRAARDDGSPARRVAAPRRASTGARPGLLTVALGTAGLLAYAFFAVSSHTLDSARLRDDRRPLVGQLHRRGDPLPADRAAALADAGRARGGSARARATCCGSPA